MLSIDTLSQWYFCVSLGKKLWMVPEQRKVSKLKLINKGHIPKIMVIAAVGTPVTGSGHSLEDKSNGKVGIWRVMQNKKRSKSGWGPGRKKYSCYQYSKSFRRDAGLVRQQHRARHRRPAVPASRHRVSEVSARDLDDCAVGAELREALELGVGEANAAHAVENGDRCGSRAA